MRTLAIGDIHGCSALLDDMLAWVEPTREDLVIVLGDIVDRGPDTRGVIDRLMRLKKELRLVCLRGNHEVMMMRAKSRSRNDEKNWLSVGGMEALGSYGSSPGRSGTLADVPAEHWQFLETELVPYYETDSHIFVHAGAYPSLPMDEQPDMMLYWEKFPDSCRHISGKQIVCGHTAQKQTGRPKVVPGAVCIDTHAHGGGWLTCLNALTGKYWQTNILGRRREGWINDHDDER